MNICSINLKTEQMSKQNKKLAKVNLSFRVEPTLMEIFSRSCKDYKITRSKAFRLIFNQHIIDLKRKENGPGISIQPGDRVEPELVEQF
jgi:hypothetical protein